MENDLENIRKKLKKVVIDYYPNSKIVDHTFMKKWKKNIVLLKKWIFLYTGGIWEYKITLLY